MDKVVLCLLALVAAAPGLRTSAFPEEPPPNIILIIGDDISPEDLGAYGNRHIRTPHIDRLARSGILFENFFVTSSSCSPSRTSLLTGRYPHNTGAAELHTPLPEHLVYFPELLRRHGYFTALAGKWHEGPHTRRSYDTLFVNKNVNGNGGEDQWRPLLQNRPKDKPFFFWFASYDAHREWSPDRDFARPYTPAEVKVPAMLRDDDSTRRDLASYYNEISRLDYHLGEVLAELEAQGISDNTMVIFMTDNPRAFPGSKTRLLDRGLKSPLLIRWPRGITRTGKRAKALVSSIDLAPTLLELAGMAPPGELQGVSFARLLKNPSEAFRNHVFAEHNWHDYEAYERSVRTENYLYIRNERPGLTNEGPIDANQSPSALSLKRNLSTLSAYQKEAFLRPRPVEEFYDIRQDPHQRHNLAGVPGAQKAMGKLKAALRQWQEETGDTTPEKLTPDWYHRDTGSALPEKGNRGEMPGRSKQAERINRKGPF